MISYAFDIGTRSIGAVIFEEIAGHHRLLWSGVTIFGAPQRQRELLKTAIKTRKRRLRRKDRLLKIRQWLESESLLPAYEETALRAQIFCWNPHDLMAKGMTTALTPHEFGRILYHVATNRGWNGAKFDACRHFKHQRENLNKLWRIQTELGHHFLSPAKWAACLTLLFKRTSKIYCKQHPTEKRLYQSQPLAEIAQATEIIGTIHYRDTHEDFPKHLNEETRSFLMAQLMMGKTISSTILAEHMGLDDANIIWPIDVAPALNMAAATLLSKAGHFGHNWNRLSINQQDHLITAIIERNQARLIEFWPDGLTFTPERLDRLLSLALPADYAPFGSTKAAQIIQHNLRSKSTTNLTRPTQKKKKHPKIFDQIFKRLLLQMQKGFAAPDKIIFEFPDTTKSRPLQNVRERLFSAHFDHKKQGVTCPYSGFLITKRNLHTQKIEVDHIVPKSRGGGDNDENLALCLATANRKKADRTPFEAFGRSAEWPKTCRRIKNWSQTKQSRFLSKTSRFSSNDQPNQASRDQTIHLAKAAILIAERNFPKAQLRRVSSQDVHALRVQNGFVKDRNDLRHHALDAALTYLQHEKAGFLSQAIEAEIHKHTKPVFVATELTSIAKSGALAYYHPHLDIIVKNKTSHWHIRKSQLRSHKQKAIKRNDLVMRIRKGDVLHLRNQRTGPKYLRIFRLQPSNGTIALGAPYLAGKEEKTPLIYKSGVQLQRLGAVKCRQQPLGYTLIA